MPFQFRDATSADLDLLWRLDQECFPPGIAYSKRELTLFMTSRGAFTVLAETSEGEPSVLAGFILAQKHKNSWGHIVTIDVGGSSRRSGLGTQLMTIAERRLVESGCVGIYLETAVDNHAAIRFYQKLGYQKIGIIRGYYQGKIDAFRMEKPLQEKRSETTKAKKSAPGQSGG